MKKLLTLLLTLLMVLTLVGCNSNKEDTPVIEESEQQEVVDEPIVGGYTEVEDKNLTPELIEMFNKAFEDFVGANYTPVRLEATQVVAGTNYKFKADGTKTTNPIIMGTYYVYINKDLEGNVSLLDIEVIEEHEVKNFEPEVEIDTEIKKDYTGVKFWVVVYDQFDNEISRTTAVYGSTVKDPDGKDVVINGNKYFYTVIDYPKPEVNDPTPTTYRVTFTGDFEYGKVHDEGGNTVTEIYVPSGTIFTSSGDIITIGENKYYAVAVDGYGLDSFNPSSGTITSETTIIVNFAQNQPPE